jgi:hypothetical protein
MTKTVVAAVHKHYQRSIPTRLRVWRIILRLFLRKSSRRETDQSTGQLLTALLPLQALPPFFFSFPSSSASLSFFSFYFSDRGAKRYLDIWLGYDG